MTDSPGARLDGVLREPAELRLVLSSVQVRKTPTCL
jgi:hypothetical protein